jgi:SAM-dependent methyltransferase
MLAPALTILLSSFLLFLVQPILAKQILPWFGGSAGVWTVCLVFFQSVLVLGYAYAHLLTRRRVGARQFAIHIALLLASCLVLPIVPAAFWKQAHEAEPAARILGLLAATVGLPYFLLASTGPLLQKWLSSGSGSRALGPAVYRLFALSNFGSLIGLLCYPFAIEPFISLHAQAWLWSSAYLVFVISSISYAWLRRRQTAAPPIPNGDPQVPANAAPSARRSAYWVGCAALGSALLLSATNQMTQNVAAIPLLWIVPLTLYLLSFTICFEGRSGRGWYERRFWITPAMLATGAMAWALWVPNVSAYVAVPLYAVGVFLGCVMCHGELARTKPRTEYLTQFYLCLAAGGALGGMLVGLVAPRIFSGYWEVPLVVAALALLGVLCSAEERRQRPRTSWTMNAVLALLVAPLILLLLGGLPHALDRYAAPWAKIVEGDARWGCAALLLVAALLLQRYRLWRTVSLAALLCVVSFGWSSYRDLSAGAQFAIRNFYGCLRVLETPYGDGRLRRLVHGTIVHGSQVVQLPDRGKPTTYYGESSGIGRTLSAYPRHAPLRIGSVGLGAGTLATYGRPGDLFRAYEINPAVLDIARNEFSYLRDSKARIELVLGDGRLSLENELAQGAFDAADKRFDVLSLDAFSGDAIPLHLLTREAFAIYARVIKPDGVIAFHVSNRFLNLAPVVRQLARDAGYQAVLVSDRPPWGLLSPSDWVLVTRNLPFLHQPDIALYGTAIEGGAHSPLWTDQFTNLLQVLK